VVDLVGEDVGGVDGAVALDDRRPVLGRRRGDLLATGAERVAAENDRQASDRPILGVLSSFVADSAIKGDSAHSRWALKAAAASSWSTIGSG
jgi:hypothetical protein